MDFKVYRLDGSVGMVRVRREDAWWIDSSGRVSEAAKSLEGVAFSRRANGSILGHVWERRCH